MTEPAVQRLRLRRLLRGAREAAGMTQAQAADALGVSVSKMVRIESGEVRVSIPDVRALVDLYGVPERLAEAEKLARATTGRVDLVQFGSGSQPVEVRRGDSLLKVLDRFGRMGGTETAAAVRQHYAGHDRVVIVTDEQAWAGYGSPGDVLPARVPLYTFNLVGYRHGHQAGGPNRVTIGGGLTDHTFRLIPLLEAGKAGTWPWVES